MSLDHTASELLEPIFKILTTELEKNSYIPHRLINNLYKISSITSIRNMKNPPEQKCLKSSHTKSINKEKHR